MPRGGGGRDGDGSNGEFGVTVNLIDEIKDQYKNRDEGEYAAETGYKIRIISCRYSHYWT